VPTDARGGRLGPRLGSDDAAGRPSEPLEPRARVRLGELELRVVATVGVGVAQRRSERGADAEHADEDGAAENERRQRQQQAALLAEGVRDGQPRRRRNEWQPRNRTVEETAGGRRATRRNRLAHRDPRPRQHGRERGQQRHDEPGGELEREHGRRQREPGRVEVDQAG
jgi:hypothetical protein